MKKLLLLFFICTSFSVKSQVNLSVYSEISIVTSGPGDELFEAFGHSAIRIKDPVLRLDLVYNYGIFDFDAPNFYTNFTKGKLLYKLGRYPFKYFLDSYRADKRWVKEQILNLNQNQKQAFFKYLEKNASPNNATYLYDPFINNCASKLKDITNTVLDDKVTYNDVNLPKGETFRSLMNSEIPWNTWGSFGINLALGNKLDRKVTTEEFMYLPDYVYTIFKDSSVNVESESQPLIKSEKILIDLPEMETKINIFNPLLIFSLISLLGIWITFKDYKKKKRTKSLDFITLFTTGLIGVLITFLWFFTDHSTTPNNLNILWAFAPNIFVAFVSLKTNLPKWTNYYFLLLLALIVIIPILWIVKIQLFPIAVIPLLIFLGVRYFFALKFLKNN